MTEAITLVIAGTVYHGWERLTVERGIDRCGAHFDIEVSERWAGQDEPWRIVPFSKAVVAIGGDTVLTGYVDEYAPAYDARSHRVRIVGRSKTEDLMDCTPDIPSGQFVGYTVAAIARGICEIFGIGVVVNTDKANVVVANTQLQRCETAFAFLERLGRLSGVLLCDDEEGNLVLANTGTVRAAGTLVEGNNILRATGRLTANRFSHYIVKGQTGVGVAGADSWGGLGDTGTPSAPSGGGVQTELHAVALDPDVPRYRPRVTLAESQLTAEGMQLRANWQRSYAAGQAAKATVTVQGYRQPDGSLWRINQLVPVRCPWLGIDGDLLTVRVRHTVDDRGGQVTDIDVGPPSGYTPDPGEVKLHRASRGHKGGKGGPGVNWDGLGGDHPTGGSA